MGIGHRPQEVRAFRCQSFGNNLVADRNAALDEQSNKTFQGTGERTNVIIPYEIADLRLAHARLKLERGRLVLLCSGTFAKTGYGETIKHVPTLSLKPVRFDSERARS